MTVEGNWIAGALSADYPDVEYTVAQLPEAPADRGPCSSATAGASQQTAPTRKRALALVEHLTSTEQQLAFADASA